MASADKAVEQRAKIEALKGRLNMQNYEFIRKEVLLGLNTDLAWLVEPGAFARYYAFRDAAKDKTLEDIRSKENRYQTIGNVASVPFIGLSVMRKDIRYFLPGLILIGGFKWYSGEVRQRLMKEERVDEYWRKSKKLDYDLKKTLKYID
jgi:hypothetical protein